MALTISTSFSTLMFSYQIADAVISSTYAEVSATLRIGSTTVHTATLFPYNGTAYFSDLRSIVEEYMASHSSHICSVQVVVTASNGSVTASSSTASVVFCAHSLPEGVTPNTFLGSHFLTINNTRSLSRSGGKVSVNGIATPGETVSIGIVFIVERSVSSGNPLRAISSSVSSQNYGSASAFSFSATYSQLLSRARSVDASTTRILGLTITAGSRSMTYFCTDAVPDITFFYANPFGCFDRLPLSAVTQTLDEKTHDTASLRRQVVFYNIRNERKYKTLAANLTETEALQVSELLSSTDVRLVDPALDDFNDYPELLVEAVDSAPSNRDDALHEATVEWRFADRRPRLMQVTPTAQSGIFTSAYNTVFT